MSSQRALSTTSSAIIFVNIPRENGNFFIFLSLHAACNSFFGYVSLHVASIVEANKENTENKFA